MTVVHQLLLAPGTPYKELKHHCGWRKNRQLKGSKFVFRAVQIDDEFIARTAKASLTLLVKVREGNGIKLDAKLQVCCIVNLFTRLYAYETAAFFSPMHFFMRWLISFWSFEISEGILRNQKIIIGLDMLEYIF